MRPNNYQNLLTIIIPAYNAKKTLLRCIKSLTTQKRNLIEIIIVDDNSQDGSNSLYIKYKKIFKKEEIKIINLKKNQGPGYCRNVGIKNSTGKYITFLDSDDYYINNGLEKIINILQKNNPDILINNNLRNKKPFLNDFFFKNFKKKKYKKNEYYNISNKYGLNLNECWKIVIKKNIIKKNQIKFPEIYIGEDQCFVYDCILKSNTFFINKNPIIYHYSSISGLSSSNLSEMTRSFIYLLYFFYKKRLKNLLEKKFISKKINYLTENLNITLLNQTDYKIGNLLNSLDNIYLSKKRKLNKSFLKNKILNSTKRLKERINFFLKNKKTKNYKIYIFSKNFLGDSIRKFIMNKKQNVSYIFDDNPKFKLIRLEKYKFDKNINNIFFIAITDPLISEKIKKRILKLNLKKQKVNLIKLF